MSTKLYYPVFASSKVTYGALITYGVIFAGTRVLLCEYANGVLNNATGYSNPTAARLEDLLMTVGVDLQLSSHDVQSAFFCITDSKLINESLFVIKDPVSLPVHDGTYINFGLGLYTRTTKPVARLLLPYTVSE